MKNRIGALACLWTTAVLFQSRPAGAGDDGPRRLVLDEFDIAKGGDVIVLPVTIVGKEYPFILSTGGEGVTVDVRLRRLLGPSLGVRKHRDLYGAGEIEVFAPPKMTIGSVEFQPNRPIGCADLSSSSERVGHDIYGVVGLDYLRDQIVQIDFDQGKFRRLAAVPDDVLLGAYTDVILKGEPGPTCVTGRVPGVKRQEFLVDTGLSGSVTIKTDVMKALIEQDAVTDINKFAFHSSGKEQLRHAGRLSSLKIGEWTFTDTPVMEMGGNSLGLSFLSRFVLTFDFKRKFLHLAPGARFGKAVPRDWLRFSIISKNGQVSVDGVDPVGVGKLAGVQVGDLIANVNDRNSAESSLFELRQTFMENDRVVLRVRRGKQEITLTMENPYSAADGKLKDGK